MVILQERSARKITGGRYKDYRKKKLFNLGSLPTHTKVGKTKVKVKRERSGSLKYTLLSANKINVIDQKTKKMAVTEIVTVADNPANRNFIRRNIITKGTILETKIGRVKVTSRPGQSSVLNGVLISEKKT